jgi:S-adenosylmethionine:tRNA ribosyltransferase-isomerase
MTDPRNISIQDYTYSLPEERIAKYPLAERDASKLLIYKDGAISEDTYKNIAHHIPENSLLIFNDTRVVEARLLFQKPTGGMIEIFCLEPHEQYSDITTAMLQKEKVWWHCLVGGVSKWKPGQVLEKRIKQAEKEIILKANYIEKRNDSFVIELSWSPTVLSFAEVLHQAGAIPLPPYIKRAVEESDAERYQTVYATIDGSVAAPTAGLHFMDTIFNRLKEKNIHSDFVTMHVGAGTFKPVKDETMAGHDMHAEWMDVSRTCIENILNNLDHNIIAVGTTSLRTIESLYWIGRKPELRSGHRLSEQSSDVRPSQQKPELCSGNSQPEQSSDVRPSQRKPELCSGNSQPEQSSGFRVSQWEAYEPADEEIPVKDALEYLLKWMDQNKLERLVAKTQILIAPGYSFKIIKGLVTNFHQPQSTLLLLVAALIGKDWKKIYEYALQKDFRFLSYGDGCLLWRSPV